MATVLDTFTFKLECGDTMIWVCRTANLLQRHLRLVELQGFNISENQDQVTHISCPKIYNCLIYFAFFM